MLGSCLYCQTSKLLNDNKTKSRVKLRYRFAARLFYILKCMAYKSKEFLNSDKISRNPAWRDVWHCDRCDEKILNMMCDASGILEHAAYWSVKHYECSMFHVPVQCVHFPCENLTVVRLTVQSSNPGNLLCGDNHDAFFGIYFCMTIRLWMANHLILSPIRGKDWWECDLSLSFLRYEEPRSKG